MQFKYLAFSFFFALLFVSTLYANSPKIHYCKLSIEQPPKINGLQLGMSLEDFKKISPKARISKLKEKNCNIKRAYIWDWNTDAYNTSATLLDDKIVRIETQFKSLKDTRNQENFYLIVADKLGLASFWIPLQ